MNFTHTVFNPCRRSDRAGRAGFTLVELLVVIGIIALLIGILLPTLNRARSSSKQIVCLSNLRSVGQGFALYASANQMYLPAAYVYNTGPGNPDVGGGTAAAPVLGYTHWSYLIYGDGESVPENAFTCPAFEDGGLPPTNPKPEDLVANQDRDPDTNAGVVDGQVRRCAYTVNEAVIPRNKFSGAVRGATPGTLLSQRIPITKVGDSANVILATEFIQNARVVSEADPTAGSFTIKSHRPLHGVTNPGGQDLTKVATNFSGGFEPSIAPPAFVVDADPNLSRISWVGRNHGSKAKRDGQDLGSSNFLYVDGHAENKLVEQTLPSQLETGGGYNNPLGDKWQWGNPIYAIVGAPRVNGVPLQQ